MSAVDHRMFGKDWWAQPLAARYASIDAAKVRLAVSVEMAKTAGYYEETPCIVWRGTADQFKATSFFTEWASPRQRSGKYVAHRQLRGQVYPDGAGRFAFVIAWAFIYGKRDIKIHAQTARADENYLNFRDAIMAGFPLAEIQMAGNGGAV